MAPTTHSAVPGRMTLADLRDAVERGEIDTVVTGFSFDGSPPRTRDPVSGPVDLWNLPYLGARPDQVIAMGLNNHGQVVGIQNGVDAGGEGSVRVFLWDAAGDIRDVSTLLDAGGSGWQLTPEGTYGMTRAVSISDPAPGQAYGRIVGSGYNHAGLRRAFVLTPQ